MNYLAAFLFLFEDWGIEIIDYGKSFVSPLCNFFFHDMYDRILNDFAKNIRI